MITLSLRGQHTASVVSRRIGDETVLVDMSQGVYFGLNAVGSQIWLLLGEGISLSEIAQALVAKYDVPQVEVEQDVLRITQQLIDRGLLQPQ